MKFRKLRVICAVLLSFSILLGSNSIALANGINQQSNVIADNENTALKSAYDELINYANNNLIPMNLDYNQFVNDYHNSNYKNVNDYIASYYNVLKPVPRPVLYGSFSSKGSAFSWQYNTGTTLPQDPNYSKYNLLDICQPGDLVYEANGGYGLTGHMAMIEGKFYDEARGKYYIRVIEANQYGVCRGVLDDDRIDRQKDTIFRVNGSDEAMRNAALNFELSQLGKGYILDFAKHTSPDTSRWYCSELTWAAYMNQGINIETQAFFNEPGVSPRDIAKSGMVTAIDLTQQ